MEATLTVPPAFVQYLRSGLFGELGLAAEKLASLAQQFGSAASDGVYTVPLQDVFTLWMLLGEIGWKDISPERSVVINLGVGARHIVKGLKDEHTTLVQQLEEIPTSTNKRIRDAAAAKVADFEEFIASVELQTRRARRSRHKPEPIHPTGIPPRSAGMSSARRAHAG
jgi:hypothetical protein